MRIRLMITLVAALFSRGLLAQDKAPMHVHDFELNADGRTLTAVGHHQGAVFELLSV